MVCWKTWPSVYVFTCDFITTVLRHITAMNCFSSYPKICPGRWIGRGHEAPYNFVARTLTLFQSSRIFLSEIFKNQGLCHHSRRTVASNSIIFKWSKEYTRNLRTLACFFFHAERSCVSAKMEAISSTCCNEVKARRLLIAVFYSSYTHSVQLRKYLRCDRRILN
jgi:hypothetical protein